MDQSRKVVAAQIIDSVRCKWGTAVALQAATGISQTEISRLRHGKFERFSLERLVRLLRIIDPEVEIKLQVTVTRTSRTSKIGEVP
ncbi:XRE family transcriptional regulator [Hyphomicrobium sp. 2TAF46]|uniref:XRE family transcriptional regulator n=1 Tax=Hyphomicrobium sp. 2TAF46 TaxID=3233019 RepID=UPI003F90E2C6